MLFLKDKDLKETPLSPLKEITNNSAFYAILIVPTSALLSGLVLVWDHTLPQGDNLALFQSAVSSPSLFSLIAIFCLWSQGTVLPEFY